MLLTMIDYYQNYVIVISIIGVTLVDSNQQIIKNSLNSQNFESTVPQALLHILKSCKKNDNIMLAVDSVKTNLKWLQDSYFTIYLSNFNHTEKMIYKHEQPINVFLYIGKLMEHKNEEEFSNFALLSHYLRDLSIPMYMVDIQKNGCKNSKLTLDYFKYNRIVTSYFLCLNANQVIEIYTYNPFTDRAPEPWKRFGSRASGYTTYKRKYIKDDICEGLYFDRTKHLDGYPFTIASELIGNNLHPDGKKVDAKFLHQLSTYLNPPSLNLFINIIAKALNVTLTVHLFHHQFPRQYSKLVHLSIADLIAIYTSCSLHSKYDDPITDRTCCFSVSEWGILTVHRGFKTPLEKMWDFYGVWTSLFTLLILWITFIVIWLVNKQKIITSLFEIIRLIIGQNLKISINTFALRVFFMMIFIYFLIIDATFHGHLAKLLTKPELRKQVDSMEDMKLLGYKAFNDVVDKKIRSQFVQTCIEYIQLNDSTLACVANRGFLAYLGSHHSNLYLNKRRGITRYTHFPISRNSLLLSRTKKMFILLNDLGYMAFLKNYMISHVTNVSVYREKVTEAKLFDANFRPISLENLTFAFIILGIGISGAFLSFCLEIYRKC